MLSDDWGSSSMKLFSVRYLIGRLETWPIHTMQRSLTLSMHPSVGEINVSVVQSIGVGEMVSMGLQSSTHVTFFIYLILDSNVLGPVLRVRARDWIVRSRGLFCLGRDTWMLRGKVSEMRWLWKDGKFLYVRVVLIWCYSHCHQIYEEQFPCPGSESLRVAHTFYLSFGPT